MSKIVNAAFKAKANTWTFETKANTWTFETKAIDTEAKAIEIMLEARPWPRGLHHCEQNQKI